MKTVAYLTLTMIASLLIGCSGGGSSSKDSEAKIRDELAGPPSLSKGHKHPGGANSKAKAYEQNGAGASAPAATQ